MTGLGVIFAILLAAFWINWEPGHDQVADDIGSVICWVLLAGAVGFGIAGAMRG